MKNTLKANKPAPQFPAPEWTSLSASMAAMLAHEIRNPLLSIKGAAQLLEQSAAQDDKSLAQLIVGEVRRIEQLVATMDPLTPDPTQVPESLNIHEVTEYVRLAARSLAPRVRFATHYDPSLPPVRGMREALVQALLNLVKNADEATADIAEPTVTISTRYLLGQHMQRTGSGVHLPVAVEIADNGPGIDPAVADRLFVPFTTTKPTGKGLGLAIVARIIEEHGGLISVDAPPTGAGARFTLYLPIA